MFAYLFSILSILPPIALFWYWGFGATSVGAGEMRALPQGL